jgi:hypothetical protein
VPALGTGIPVIDIHKWCVAKRVNSSSVDACMRSVQSDRDTVERHWPSLSDDEKRLVLDQALGRDDPTSADFYGDMAGALIDYDASRKKPEPPPAGWLPSPNAPDPSYPRDNDMTMAELEKLDRSSAYTNSCWEITQSGAHGYRPTMADCASWKRRLGLAVGEHRIGSPDRPKPWPVPAALRLPVIDPQAHCLKAMQYGGSSGLSKKRQGLEVAKCARREKEALASLKREWPKLASEVKKRCLDKLTGDGGYGYRELAACLAD